MEKAAILGLFFQFLMLLGLGQQEISIEQLLEGQDLSILDEKLEINIYGKENLPEAFQVKRKVRYQILRPGGVQKLSHHILPENLDPTFIAHGPEVKKLGVFYSGYKVEFFKVKVLRKGKEVKYALRKKVTTSESFNLDYLYDYDRHHYYLDGMEVGDEVIIDYHVDIPFRENYSRFASFRLFFHSDIPKLKYEFKLSHHRSLDFELYGYNGAESIKPVERDKLYYYTWKFNNLSSCISETNARPYKELPHITWVINHYRYFVFNSNNLENVPHYAIVAGLRSPALFDILRSLEIGSRSQQFMPFNRTYEKLIVGQPEDFERLRYIHNHIARHFKYEDDLSYYRRDDFRGDRLGEYFENGVIRDHSRYDLYYAILVKSEEQFYSSFLIDKRSGEISDSYFQPTFDNDFILANYFGERNFDFVHPKRSEFGWFYNELPFYWEDCLTRLVHISDYASYKMPIKDVFRTARTFLTGPEQNKRYSSTSVRIDTDVDSLYFQSRVSLSGQFSTICRPVYMGYKLDPSVDASYAKAIWKKEGVRLTSLEESLLSDVYPYRAEFNCAYVKSLDGAKAMNSVDISDWFDHVLPDPGSGNRSLSYYPDFMGEDVFEYDLQFPKPVEVLNELDMEIDNDFGRFTCLIANTSPTVIRLHTRLEIKTGKVDPENVGQIREIISALEGLKELRFNYK